MRVGSVAACCTWVLKFVVSEPRMSVVSASLQSDMLDQLKGNLTFGLGLK